jgi:hypothetical protein
MERFWAEAKIVEYCKSLSRLNGGPPSKRLAVAEKMAHINE